jgi:hypothetical protein
MGELASTSPPLPASTVLRVVFVDGERTVNLGIVTVQPSLGVHKLQSVVGLVAEPRGRHLHQLGVLSQL